MPKNQYSRCKKFIGPGPDVTAVGRQVGNNILLSQCESFVRCSFVHQKRERVATKLKIGTYTQRQSRYLFGNQLIASFVKYWQSRIWQQSSEVKQAELQIGFCNRAVGNVCPVKALLSLLNVIVNIPIPMMFSFLDLQNMRQSFIITVQLISSLTGWN